MSEKLVCDRCSAEALKREASGWVSVELWTYGPGGQALPKPFEPRMGAHPDHDDYDLCPACAAHVRQSLRTAIGLGPP